MWRICMQKLSRFNESGPKMLHSIKWSTFKVGNIMIHVLIKLTQLWNRAQPTVGITERIQFIVHSKT